MDISSKFCPICHNKNDSEAIVCVHCGASLEIYNGDHATTRSTDMQTMGPRKLEELLIDEAMVPAGEIAIYIEGSSEPIFSSSDREFVIGRKVEEPPGPFLDLAVFGGYHLGLSRRHAAIRRAEHGYEVMDLSSSNGTWLNGERLIPNQPYPLASGSQLRLARMRFLVLYRPVMENQ